MRIFFFGHGNFWLYVLGYMFWVMEIAELNFYVAELQESRESPNVESAMGSIVTKHKKCHQ